MKQMVLLVSICVLLTGLAFGDASEMTNAFNAFGACDSAPLFEIASDRGILGTQNVYTTGVLGACIEIVNDGSDRIEGSTSRPSIEFAGLSGTDVDLSFYLKIGGTPASSYPRLAIRQDPNTPATPLAKGEVGDCASFVEWTNTEWTYDNAWHEYTPNISTLNWDGVTTGDFFINDYFAKTFYIDEIVLRDPTPKDASDDAKNVFAAIGDCEADLFTEATADNSTDIDDAQTSATGVVGQCCKCVIPPLWSRLQASTADQATAGILKGTDAELKFYYKIVNGGYSSSYPFIYFRQNVTDNNTSPHPAAGADKVVYWNCSSSTGIGGETFSRDAAWHLFQPDISDFDWGAENTDLVINGLSASGGPDGEFWIDEIYLTDPTFDTSVDDWGLY